MMIVYCSDPRKVGTNILCHFEIVKELNVFCILIAAAGELLQCCIVAKLPPRGGHVSPTPHATTDDVQRSITALYGRIVNGLSSHCCCSAVLRASDTTKCYSTPSAATTTASTIHAISANATRSASNE
jgi:hypothetical protein